MSMQLWPAIDLFEGKAVRLHQGRYDEVTVYSADPVGVASTFRQFSKCLHVVDLEGARAGRPVQAGLIRSIVEAFGPGVQVGGGVRDRAAVEGYLDLGVDRVVLGTAAIGRPELIRECATEFPGRIVVALDAKDGRVATHGWQMVSDRTAKEVAVELAELPIAAILYTDVSRDGTRVGPNAAATDELARASRIPVLASGGVGSLDDIRRLASLGTIAGVIVGKALYEKTFSLKDAVAAADALA